MITLPVGRNTVTVGTLEGCTVHAWTACCSYNEKEYSYSWYTGRLSRHGWHAVAIMRRNTVRVGTLEGCAVHTRMACCSDKKVGQFDLFRGGSRGGPWGPGPPPLTTKNEAPAPKFYKTEAPEWQF